MQLKRFIVTQEQADLLNGKVWGYEGQVFFPQPDADGNLVISPEEVHGCTLAQAIAIGCDSWLLTLQEIDYNPVISNTLP
jgi:hypothetical protein